MSCLYYLRVGAEGLKVTKSRMGWDGKIYPKVEGGNMIGGFHSYVMQKRGVVTQSDQSKLN